MIVNALHHNEIVQTETVEEPIEEEEAGEEGEEKKEGSDEDEEDEDDATVEEEEEKPKTKKVGVASRQMVGVSECCLINFVTSIIDMHVVGVHVRDITFVHLL